MSEEIEKLLKELDCEAYEYDKNHKIYRNDFFSSDVHLMYKELVAITSMLDSLKIKYKISDNNILLSQ